MERISVNDPKVVEKVVETLKNGGMVVYPTETCYGIGVDATNPQAVEKLLEYKTRPEGKPISVAVTDMKMASEYVEINEIARNIYENYLPGPITVVSKGKQKVVSGIESEYKTLGIRVPDYPLITEIIRKLGKPITATSANVSYKSKPYSVEALAKDTPNTKLDLIDLAIDASELPKRKTSTVVDTTLNSINVLREGKIQFEKPGKQILDATTKTAEETVNFGSTIILKFLDDLQNKCIVMALGGELGTGKTQLAKGIGRELGIKQTIKSPTFTVISEYPYSMGPITGQFVHIDTWRLGDPTEFSKLDIQKYITPGNVIVIEWADKFYNEIKRLAEFAKKNTIFLKVQLNYVDPDTRKIEVERFF